VVESAWGGVGSVEVDRLFRVTDSVCAQAGRVGPAAGVAVRLLGRVRRVVGAAPVLEEVEVFGNLLAEQCDRLQSRLRQGPRVLAERGRCSVLVADLHREQRWPVFRATAASRYGLAAVHVEPLMFRGGPAIGSLAWYTDRPSGFSSPAALARRREYAAQVTVRLLATWPVGPAGRRPPR
jgi:hypothetical protein